MGRREEAPEPHRRRSKSKERREEPRKRSKSRSKQEEDPKSDRKYRRSETSKSGSKSHRKSETGAPLSKRQAAHVKEKMTYWLDLGDQIKAKTDEIHIIKGEKQKVESSIIEFLQKKGAEEIDVFVKGEDGQTRARVRPYISKTRKGIKEDDIKQVLTRELGSERKALAIVKVINDQREESQKVYLKRTKGGTNEK